MSAFGRIVGLFPALVLGTAAGMLVWFAASPNPWALLGLVFALYVLPVATFRLHQWRWPLRSGGSRLLGKKYSAWWGGHQIQLVYLMMPALESVLRAIPGLYSFWLRAWGSRIGDNVHWTPRVEVGDRSLLEVGDNVIFGHRAVLFGHIIKPTRNNLLLYVKPVRVGDGAFIGAGAVLAPGVEVKSGALVEAGTHLYPNRVQA